MKKVINHLDTGQSDYTLCGYGGDEMDEFGVANQITAEETYESTAAERTQYKTNCKRCQETMLFLLKQIK